MQLLEVSGAVRPVRRQTVKQSEGWWNGHRKSNSHFTFVLYL